MGILMLSYYHSDCVLGCLDCIRGAWQQMEKNHLGPASEQAFQAQIISADFSSFRALLGLRNHSRVWWGGEMRGCCISLIIDFRQLQSMSLKVSEAAELQTPCCLECLGSRIPDVDITASGFRLGGLMSCEMLVWTSFPCLVCLGKCATPNKNTCSPDCHSAGLLFFPKASLNISGAWKWMGKRYLAHLCSMFGEK